MVVDAVLMLDDLLPLNMIGIKQVQGGALEVSFRLIEIMYGTFFTQIYLIRRIQS